MSASITEPQWMQPSSSPYVPDGLPARFINNVDKALVRSLLVPTQ
jgi:hypothetical protein